MGKLEGKVAIISGVARGQGRSHAVRLAQEGADIIGFDILESDKLAGYPLADKKDLDETIARVKATGASFVAGQADVRDRASIGEIVKTGLQEFGHIDCVVANAGVAAIGRPFWEIPSAEWDFLLAVNLTGVLNTVSSVIPSMIEAGTGGSVIITSSAAGMKGPPNIAAYSASKHGVIGLMKTMANELAPHLIRVNAICPNSVRTPIIMNDRLYRLLRPDLEHPTLEDAIPVFTDMNLIKKPWIEAEDVSSFVSWLASDESWYMTGQAVPLDLGLNVKW